jgi:hypothetical protein
MVNDHIAATVVNADGAGTPPGDTGDAKRSDTIASFEVLFAGCAGAIHLVAMSPDGGRVAEHWIRPAHDRAKLRQAVLWAQGQSQAGRNVYVCPVTMAPDAKDRSERAAFEVPALFADVDLESGADLVGVAGKLLDTARVSGVVASGQGLHVYARLATPIRVTDSNREELKDLLYAFGAALNEVVHGEFRRPERHDLASLLRVPGTVNWPSAKKRALGRKPLPTAVLVPFEGTIAPEALGDWRSRYPRPRPAADSPTADKKEGIGELPRDWEERLRHDYVLRAYWERAAPLSDGDDCSPSGYLMRLANRLVREYPDDTDEQRLAILHAFYSSRGEPKSLQAIQRTLEKAKAQPEQQPLTGEHPAGPDPAGGGGLARNAYAPDHDNTETEGSPLASLMANVEGVVGSHFPEALDPLKACLAVAAVGCLADNGQPTTLILVGRSGAGKTLALSLVLPESSGAAHAQHFYRSDKFTPASFVSHRADRDEKKLKQIDLLPRIKNKTLVTKELAPLFGGKREELMERFRHPRGDPRRPRIRQRLRRTGPPRLCRAHQLPVAWRHHAAFAGGPVGDGPTRAANSPVQRRPSREEP